MFRIDRIVFNNLLHNLVTHNDLEWFSSIGVAEMFGMFFYILGHGIGNKLVQECFYHSQETISRYFVLVLEKVFDMGKDRV